MNGNRWLSIVVAAAWLTGCPADPPPPAEGGGDVEPSDVSDGTGLGEVGDVEPSDVSDGTGLGEVGDVEPSDVSDGTELGDLGEEEEAPFGALTWHKDLRPLVAAQCFPCHESAGAAGYGREFETFEQVSVWGPVMAFKTQAREMPPWPPDENCRSYRGERLLTNEEIATFQIWVDDGKWEGDPADYVAPDVPEEVKPEAILPAMDAGADYILDSETTDDYHCLPMTYVVEEPMFMTGYDLLPDAKEVVHHALIYEIPPAMADELEANDAADPDVGYECGTTPQTSVYGIVGSWVPGQKAQVFPEDSGIYLEPGTRFVLQMHYNVLGVPPGSPMPADRTSLVLYTRPVTPLPAYTIYFSLLVDSSLLIPPGAVGHVEGKSFGLPGGATMVGIFPHMHLLGTEIRAHVEHEDGSETCLIDIPQWDFDWQQFFMFDAVEPFVTQTNDVLHLECVFDNSAANQPVIGGVQQEPKTVNFGEGTTDEMCLVFPMWLRDCVGDVCPGLSTCMEGCTEGELTCYVTCTTLSGADCGACSNGAAYQCGLEYCPDEYLTYIQCNKGGDACAGELDAWYACAEPVIKSGACDRHFLCCGAQFGE